MQKKKFCTKMTLNKLGGIIGSMLLAIFVITTICKKIKQNLISVSNLEIIGWNYSVFHLRLQLRCRNVNPDSKQSLDQCWVKVGVVSNIRVILMMQRLYNVCFNENCDFVLQD